MFEFIPFIHVLCFRMPDKVIVLNEGAPWGFRMTGGKNTGSPLKISRVMYFNFSLYIHIYTYIVYCIVYIIKMKHF